MSEDQMTLQTKEVIPSLAYKPASKANDTEEMSIEDAKRKLKALAEESADYLRKYPQRGVRA